MSRVGGWESLLAAHIEAARHTPFAWGAHDCALWAADWVRLCTGEDHAAGWRGRYQTELGAARLLSRRGYGNVAALADALAPAVPVAKARRGDVVQHPDGHLGVCAGRLSYFPATDGITEVETLRCLRAWAVG